MHTQLHDRRPQEIHEEVARKIAIDDAHRQEIKSQSYYLDEAPEQCTFVSENDEIAHYDMMTDEDFLSEEDSAIIMSAWKNSRSTLHLSAKLFGDIDNQAVTSAERHFNSPQLSATITF